ncbi:MAG: serine/threonine-protein kinase [Planctomycetota bacterium]
MDSIHNSMAESAPWSGGNGHDANAGPLEPGTLIGGRYRLVKRIGGGASADVFSARDVRAERDIAIKLVATDSGSDQTLRAFQREMDVVRQLDSCPWIVPVFDFGHDAGRPYLVMPLLQTPEQLTLADYVRRAGRPDAKTVRKIALDVARGLDHAHRRGVFHRDVSPNNIVVSTFTLSASVLDFGMAALPARGRVSTPGSAGANTDTAVRTLAGLGTPGFAAPEVVKRAPVIDGARRDVYSLGAVIYWMLTGDVPPMPATAPRLRKTLASAPKDMRELLIGMLMPEPERRIASMPDVIDVLEQSHDHVRERRPRKPLVRPWMKRAGSFLLFVSAWAVVSYGMRTGCNMLRDGDNPAAGNREEAAILAEFDRLDKAFGSDEVKRLERISEVGHEFVVACLQADQPKLVANFCTVRDTLQDYPIFNEPFSGESGTAWLPRMKAALEAIRQIDPDAAGQIGLAGRVSWGSLADALERSIASFPKKDTRDAATILQWNSWARDAKLPEPPADQVAFHASNAALTAPDTLLRARLRMIGRWGTDTTMTRTHVMRGLHKQSYVIVRAKCFPDGACVAEVQLPESADPDRRYVITRVAGYIVGLEPVRNALE